MRNAEHLPRSFTQGPLKNVNDGGDVCTFGLVVDIVDSVDVVGAGAVVVVLDVVVVNAAAFKQLSETGTDRAEGKSPQPISIGCHSKS